MKNKGIKKFLLIAIVIVIIISGIIYVTGEIQKNTKNKVDSGKNIKNNDNSVWIGTFQLAWNDFMNEVVKGDIEFEDGQTNLTEELNKQRFKKEMLSEEDYYIKIGRTSNTLKSQIEKDINSKFGIGNLEELKQISFDDVENGYTIYSMLYKEFEFNKSFDKLESTTFNDGKEMVEYFGINNASDEILNKNVEVLFYNDTEDFAVKLKTKEKEDVILYCNDNVKSKSFNELYNEIKEKSQDYKGNIKFTENDELRVPYINVDTIIRYEELCNKNIKGTEKLYITNAIQNVKFSLNERGGNLISNANIQGEYISDVENSRRFYYTNRFVIFLEENKGNPYFALKVDNNDFLVINRETK